MGLCFLVGSKRYENEGYQLEVLHYIEYITYDLENETVEVWADFIVRNRSNENPLRLCGLHRGNIGFESRTSEWLEDTKWTKVLLKYAPDEMGLVRKDDTILLCEFGNKPIPVQLVHGPLNPCGPKRPNDGKYVPFSCWESPPVESGKTCLFRVAGTIKGETYRKLLPKLGSSKPISIIGGIPLQEEISQNIEGEYKSYYEEFYSEHLLNPMFYHVFFERVGSRSLKTKFVSPDMKKVYVNEPFEGQRFINWFWSNTDFNVYTQANGPCIEMAIPH
ncbi:MAG: hypothetical protein HQ580_01620 [Planctomycetes bacterium]|nr:hypothetical protein [Planctomycetota bacterium]